MTENKRVVITGMGALSPIGNDAQTSWENALKGVNGIDTITRIDTEDYNVHLAGELKDFNVEDHIEKKEARRMDRFTQYASYVKQLKMLNWKSMMKLLIA